MELLRYAGNSIALGLAQVRQRIGAFLPWAFIVACQTVAVPSEVGLGSYEFSHPAMGTLFRITLFAPTAAVAKDAASAAFDRIDAIEAVATDYDGSSEARQLAGATDSFRRLSADLGQLVLLSERIYRESGGAFDPTVGILTREWRRSFRQGEWPRRDRWETAAGAVGFGRHVVLRPADPVGGSEGMALRLRRSGMRLDFGGVAKGFAVDAALDVLEQFGVEHALVDGGGDLAARRPPPGKRGWQVAVAPFGDDAEGPPMRFLLSHGAIATSGDAYQGARLRGDPIPGLKDSAQRFGHVLDPRTQVPLSAPRAAVVVASTAAEADAWATALMVLGEEGIESGVTDPNLPSLNKAPLRRGIFFRGPEAEPCAGDSFPHDGYVHLTPPSE